MSVARPILFIFYFLFSGQTNVQDKNTLVVVVRVWSPFKSVSDSPALHSRWSLLLKKMEISLIYHIWFILSQINLKFILLCMTRSNSIYICISSWLFRTKFLFSPFILIMQISFFFIKIHIKIFFQETKMN